MASGLRSNIVGRRWRESEVIGWSVATTAAQPARKYELLTRRSRLKSLRCSWPGDHSGQTAVAVSSSSIIFITAARTRLLRNFNVCR
ncbi:unnamed protein product, partial [Nesidiocoris tenuis]